MIKLYLASFFFVLSTISVRARYVFYYDPGFPNIPDRSINSGIGHVIITSANSSLFTISLADDDMNLAAIESISNLRSSFDGGTKVLTSIGSWSDTVGFAVEAATSESRKLFATNVAKFLWRFNLDGVDIDWEFPGGNGEDYRQIPNSEKKSEIDTFPLLLADIRSAIGPEKLLTITAPCKLQDMIAFTPAKAPSIWQSVDWVNLKSFDFMSRRDSITRHNSDVKSCVECVDYYIHTLHLDPRKINLGFALHAKWFTIDFTQGCETGLGCRTVPLEASDGSATGKLGVISFEAKNFGKPPLNMTESSDGICGPLVSKFCPSGLCCSSHGFCGDTAPYCNECLGPSYGSGCTTTPDTLFQEAMKNGITDQAAGAQYFFDKEKSLFWSWDTPDIIKRKFFEIVAARELGGVVAWSLGQDDYDYSHISALRDGVVEMKDAWLRRKLQLLSASKETGW
ncbi:hypothetical protein K3495_g2855 [Podosphaera aphanis]|nr:hypothetical protein K3495_g2855 [Podosphaera aphanis]